MNYLVSVGIATRNRQYYAERVIRRILEIGKLFGENIEVCVSDNSDDSILEKNLSDIIKNNSIKYLFCPKKISVVRNYDNTAKMATGEYYICIGDDDLILPTIFDVITWMKENNLDAVRTSRRVGYLWPIPGEAKGKLVMGPFTDNSHRFDAIEGVIQVLKNGCQGYLNTDMAGSYHALVKMNKMREVQRKTGYYFSGFSPDIYSAVCLSLIEGIKCAYFDFPVSIPGACNLSATYRAVKRIAVSSVDEAIINFSEEGYQWEKTIPYYYVPETTWADSALKGVKLMGRQDLIEKYFDRELLINIVYGRWIEYRNPITKILTPEEKALLHKNKKYKNPNKTFSNRNRLEPVQYLIEMYYNSF